MNRESLRGRSAVAAVLFVILLALAIMPQATQYALWLFPVPMSALVALRFKWIPIAMAVISGTLLIALGFSWVSLLIAGALYFVSRLLGEALERGGKLFPAFVTSTIVFIVLEIVFLALAYVSGFDLNTEIHHMVQSVSQNNPSVTGLGLSSTAQLASVLTEYTTVNFPAIICMLAFGLTACNVILARFLLGSQVPYSPFLRVWRLPQSVIGIYVLGMACVFLNFFTNDSLMWSLLNSVVTLGSFFIGIQGLAFLWRRLLKSPARYLWMVILILLASVLGYVYVLLGLVDAMRMGMRRRP